MTTPRESQLRRRAHAAGLTMHKSRVHEPNLDNLGGWMLVAAATNSVAGGSRYDLDLDDIEVYLLSQTSRPRPVDERRPSSPS